jgi:hypothetical protein
MESNIRHHKFGKIKCSNLGISAGQLIW